ncbi:calcium-binding protein, partial [Phycobacter sp. K97]|uniref:calcium-binding protein n=1 Tax=Phycobacter sedimenti TaxID=3133977 RepID=UPI00311F405E
MTRFAVLGRAALPSQYHSATAPVLVSAQAGQLLELHAGRGSAVHVFALSGTGVQLQGTRQTDSPSVLARIQSDTFILEGAALDRLVSVGNQGPLGISRSEVFYSGQSGFAGDLASVLSAPVGGRDLLVAAGAGLPGLQSFERLADGSLRALQWRSDTGSSYARDVSAMASLELGGTRYVFTAAQSESGISSYALTAGGQLNLRASLGAAEGVGLNLPTALHATEVGGQAMLLVGAAGSGSLSVMAVAADGRLSLRDHLSDTLETRFAGVQVLNSITHAGWTYVVAGGSDDGLTLFALLPGGRLIPLDSIADTAALGLDNVNGLALSVVGNRLNVLATSESEPGVTHLGIDIARSGAILAGGDSQLSGGSGDDIVIGGAAQGRLSGGGGRDIFVLQADSNPDCTVMDFDLEEDRIDLKAWEGLRSVAQVQITTRSDGAQLSFGGHELRLITSDGSSLTYEDFLRSDLLGLYRPPLPAQTPRQITGGDGDEQLLGAAGPDQLRGMGGADTLFGQDGEDSLWGGSGGDLLYGGGDRDHLYGEDDDDQLFGEDGPDQIYGGAGPDSLYGGLGDDLLDGEAGADRIWGDAGNDSLFGNSSTDQLHGGAGDDSLVGGTGDDTLYGGDGNDTLYG